MTRRYSDGLRVGSYDGQLEASTAVRLTQLFRYVLGVIPLDAYQIDEGKVGTPAVVVDDLTSALTLAIEELTRPVDAIKHQAKTVTVGISRSDETLLEVALVRSLLDAGAPRDWLTYRTLRTLADISPAIAAVVGFTAIASRGTPGPRRRSGPPPSRWSTGVASPATSPAVPTGRRSCAAPSAASPTSASCSWAWAGGTTVRSSSCPR